MKKKQKATKPRLNGSSPPEKWKFHSSSGRITSNADGIFPIMKQEENGDFLLVGTGFFVSANGMFITAKHVLRDVCNEQGIPEKAIGGFHFREDGTYFPREVLKAWSSGKTDLSIGILAQAHHNETGDPLVNSRMTLTLNKPELQEEVVTFAYPDFTLKHDGYIQELSFSPNFYEGIIEENHSEGRDAVVLPWPCYRTSMHIHGGASGGPVVGQSGKVFGVNCCSMEPDTDISYVIPIDDILENGVLDDIDFKPDGPSGRVHIKELVERGIISVE